VHSLKPSLSTFSPLISGWFGRRYGVPTPVQSAAWPLIAAGKHVLLSAPTGSGKTLAAFLYALDRLLTGAWPTGGVRVLYVSPLKALNNDIQRNLLAPLAELQEAWSPGAGMDPGKIRVMTRSGDTPQADRERMRRKPPEILITTPESLNLLLSSPRSLETLKGVRSVILDEIHAVAGSKRGTHLITAVERVTRLSGELQRIAISATVRPIERIADFVAGFESSEASETSRRRSIETIDLGARKPHAIAVRFLSPPEEEPEKPPSSAGGEPFWERLVPEIRSRVMANRSTLIFATNRRHAEKLALLLNQDQEEVIAFAHHGSLSREVRLGVEERLKAGLLRAIVATSSLELGIDVGAVEEVLFFKTPLSLTSTLQMAGRSGHQVGATSRSTFYPLFGRDLVDAAIAGRAVEEGWIEETRPPECPLDVLAQIVLSMAGTEEWAIDEMLALLRRSYPYRNLTRRQLDMVLAMLGGKYADTRIRELRRRVYLDRLEDTVTAPRESLRLIYHSGGTIPDRGYYGLKVRGTAVRLGELDEEFVWERKVGEIFVFGNKPWKIYEIGDRDVEVAPAASPPRILPFWKGESIHRRVEYSDRVLGFLGEAERLIGAGGSGTEALEEWLESDYHFDRAASRALSAFLAGQREHTGASLPSAKRLVIEETHPNRSKAVRHIVLLTLFGGVVNYPLGLLLLDRLESELGPVVTVFSDNDSVVIQTEGNEPTLDSVHRTLLSLPTSYPGIEAALRARLEGSGLFGTRFRENAGRALLLPRAGFDRRTPLWVNRMRARGLLQAVSGHDDFPLTAETWRTCLKDDFDLPALVDRLSDIRDGRITISTTSTTTPSPFARSTLWQHTNLRMYETDEPRGTAGGSSLSSDILREIAMDRRLRPEIPKAVAESFEARLQRLLPGYAPTTEDELLDWVKERLAIPELEWEALISRLPPEVSPLDPGILHLDDPGVVVARERLPEVALLLGLTREEIAARSDMSPKEASEDTPRRLFVEWLAFYGPVTPEYVGRALGMDDAYLTDLVDGAAEDEKIVRDLDDAGSFCDYRNYESLLRLLRRRNREASVALPAAEILPFLRSYQQSLVAEAPADLAGAILTALEGYPAPVHLWDTEILPRLIDDFQPADLESLFRNRELLWVGTGRRRITLIAPADLELVRDESKTGEASSIFPDSGGWYALRDLIGREPDGPGAPREGRDHIVRRLWGLAWNGLATADSFEVLTQGSAADRVSERGPRRRKRFGGPLGGSRGALWRSLPDGGTLFSEYDAYDFEELRRDRARLLLDRYGIVFREMLSPELPELSWGRLFRTLRVMELSGEVVGGVFFAGIPGIQFARPEVVERLGDWPGRGTNESSSGGLLRLSAMDPISLCGRNIEGLAYDLPPRVPGITLVYDGATLLAVARRGGSEVSFHVPPTDDRLREVVEILKVPVTRRIRRITRLIVRRINGDEAARSRFAKTFHDAGFVTDRQELVFWARYQ
jgi:ATP-dependent helicase Lhr and Lhr-like helicase